MKIKQISVGNMDNLCYVLAEGKEAVIIDPGWDAGKILREVKGLNVIGIIITHNHFDHTTAVQEIKNKIKINIYGHEKNSLAEIKLREGDELAVGKTKIEVIYTPGHTMDSICLLAGNNLFTGDTLFVHGYGRTDFGGDEGELFKSIRRLMNLPPDTVIYPGHDYGGKKTTIGELK
ncbi:MBL fold metallo-hydrolase [Candidatus Woesearchaeota archaeon]|nr:MBL fold metallo-hydrolase [Candidatus Woesearchaeota archaeon]